MTRPMIHRAPSRWLLTGLAGLALVAGLSVGAVAPAGAAAGDPSQWGALGGKDPEFPVTPNLARHVNEYEGQHR